MTVATFSCFMATALWRKSCRTRSCTSRVLPWRKTTLPRSELSNRLVSIHVTLTGRTACFAPLHALLTSTLSCVFWQIKCEKVQSERGISYTFCDNNAFNALDNLFAWAVEGWLSPPLHQSRYELFFYSYRSCVLLFLCVTTHKHSYRQAQPEPSYSISHPTPC